LRITSLHITGFKRFADLTVSNIPSSARLVVLAGPNGSGKSSLFDAFLARYRMLAGWGTKNEPHYYDRPGEVVGSEPSHRITIAFDPGLPQDPEARRKLFYFRSAYRNDPEFRLQSLSRVPASTADQRLQRMIETDVTVAVNYQRIASQALEDILVTEGPVHHDRRLSRAGRRRN